MKNTGRKKGITLSQMWKFLILLMALFTWIRKATMHCVFVTSSGGIWSAKKWRNIQWHAEWKLTLNRKTFISHYIITIMKSQLSPGFHTFPQSLSEMLPLYNSLRKVIAPEGEIPTSPLTVVWFLYELKSLLFNNKLLGIWHFSSVQSRMTLVLGYFALKSSGIVLSISSRVGQKLMVPKQRYIKFKHEIKILLTVDCEIRNKNAKCCPWNPCRRQHITKKILLVH